MKNAKLNSTPISFCPYCGEELPGGKPHKAWRKHRRQHYNWATENKEETDDT